MIDNCPQGGDLMAAETLCMSKVPIDGADPKSGQTALCESDRPRPLLCRFFLSASWKRASFRLETHSFSASLLPPFCPRQMRCCEPLLVADTHVYLRATLALQL